MKKSDQKASVNYHVKAEVQTILEYNEKGNIEQAKEEAERALGMVAMAYFMEIITMKEHELYIGQIIKAEYNY